MRYERTSLFPIGRVVFDSNKDPMHWRTSHVPSDILRGLDRSRVEDLIRENERLRIENEELKKALANRGDS